jgi:hypothetical protein
MSDAFVWHKIIPMGNIPVMFPDTEHYSSSFPSVHCSPLQYLPKVLKFSTLDEWWPYGYSVWEIFLISKISAVQGACGHTVILANWSSEIWKTDAQRQPRQIVHKIPPQQISVYGCIHLSSQAYVVVEIRRIMFSGWYGQKWDHIFRITREKMVQC